MVREALEKAGKETIRAGEIVRRLRDFVRPSEAERHVESLARLVTEANALALVGSHEHGIEVQVRLDPEANEVFVDRIQVQQVLTNLIRNAIDAMLSSPERHLMITSSRGPEDMVTLTVEDTGTGIDPGIAGQVFQPFVSSKRTGMGVGLAICRTIVEGQGGRIWFEHRVDDGTAFHFTLPLAGAGG
jgi:two-component system sensor kinase FixL